jgi:hypothetical protein
MSGFKHQTAYRKAEKSAAGSHERTSSSASEMNLVIAPSDWRA